jgi:plasmid stabilization system protein ParE
MFQIGEWIEQDSPVRAATFVEDLYLACSELGDMPRAFSLLPHRVKSGIRRRPFGDYLIFYCISNDTVEVLHVLHGARDYDKILFPK